MTLDIWHDDEGVWAQVGPDTLGPFASEAEAEAAAKQARRARFQALIEQYGQSPDDYDEGEEEDPRPYLDGSRELERYAVVTVNYTSQGHAKFFFLAFDKRGAAEQRAVEYAQDSAFEELPVAVVDLDTGEEYTPAYYLPEDTMIAPTIEQERVFDQWLLNGKAAPEVESAEHRAKLLTAFAHGWRDRVAFKGDFARMGYSLLSGEKIAYVVGRQLAPRTAPAKAWDPKDTYYREED